jgi:hypothetical protein
LSTGQDNIEPAQLILKDKIDAEIVATKATAPTVAGMEGMRRR